MSKVYFPLTLSQQDVYVDQFNYPNNPTFNFGGYIRFGYVDIKKLARIHRHIISCNDAFGIRIVEGAKGVSQTVTMNRSTFLPLIDFTNSNEPQIEASQWVTRLLETPFDIDNAPLFRAYLLKVSANEHWCVGMAHHLSMDGMGFANWVGQIGRAYNGESVSAASSTKLQDVVLDDQLYLSSECYAADRKFWSENRILTPQKLLLPLKWSNKTLHKPNPLRSIRDKCYLAPELVAKVKGVSKQFTIGINHIFLASFAIYFSQVYQQQTLVIGLPMHNRKTVKRALFIGPLYNVIPLLLDIDGNQCFLDIVRIILEKLKQTYECQRYPLGHMVREIGIFNNDSSLFDVGFNYQNFIEGIKLEESHGELVHVGNNFETTPLVLYVMHSKKRNYFELQFEYNLGYFDQNGIDVLKSRFLHLLEMLLTHNKTPIGRLTF